VNERVVGRDGKSYPARYLQGDEVILLVHRLRHAEHLSELLIIDALAARYGIRRSTESVHNYLTRYSCEACE
jgi:hypothetical protein